MSDLVDEQVWKTSHELDLIVGRSPGPNGTSRASGLRLKFNILWQLLFERSLQGLREASS